MPSRVALVHDDVNVLDALAAALTRDGRAVARSTEPMAALNILETTPFELLITRVEFERHTIHGVALANMAKHKHPDLRVLFVGRPETRAFTEGVGRLLGIPATVHDVLENAEQLLALVADSV